MNTINGDLCFDSFKDISRSEFDVFILMCIYMILLRVYRNQWTCVAEFSRNGSDVGLEYGEFHCADQRRELDMLSLLFFSSRLVMAIAWSRMKIK